MKPWLCFSSPTFGISSFSPQKYVVFIRSFWKSRFSNCTRGSHLTHRVAALFTLLSPSGCLKLGWCHHYYPEWQQLRHWCIHTVSTEWEQWKSFHYSDLGALFHQDSLAAEEDSDHYHTSRTVEPKNRAGLRWHLATVVQVLLRASQVGGWKKRQTSYKIRIVTKTYTQQRPLTFANTCCIGAQIPVQQSKADAAFVHMNINERRHLSGLYFPLGHHLQKAHLCRRGAGGRRVC